MRGDLPDNLFMRPVNHPPLTFRHVVPWSGEETTMSGAETLVGVIDVGANTIHLAVVAVATDGSLRSLADETELARLGADVSATGNIGAQRMERAVNIIGAQLKRAQSLRPAVIFGVATEGVRAAANSAEFIARVERACALRLRLVTGEQEAALTYWGATWRWANEGGRQAVLDLGGGSIEIVVGERRRVEWRVSLPLGSGALTARHIHSDPPTGDELDAVRAEVSAALSAVTPPLPVARVAACGGTATTLPRLATAPRPGDLSAAHANDETILTRAAMEQTIMRLMRQPLATLATDTGVEEGRLRLLGPGAVALLGAMGRLGVASLTVSREGIREGVALAYAHGGDEWPALASVGAGW
jgi:exopolyphosphatase/guanosine-5'-triphosphate,3'-diphosphate pyrophosphatase